MELVFIESPMRKVIQEYRNIFPFDQLFGEFSQFRSPHTDDGVWVRRRDQLALKIPVLLILQPVQFLSDFIVQHFLLLLSSGRPDSFLPLFYLGRKIILEGIISVKR